MVDFGDVNLLVSKFVRITLFDLIELVGIKLLVSRGGNLILLNFYAFDVSCFTYLKPLGDLLRMFSPDVIFNFLFEKSKILFRDFSYYYGSTFFGLYSSLALSHI